ncbi:MAG: hypothetical protein FWC27_13635 [Firmicutes bacterium]|nr:hypothetical protein [Bacillota bacterium]
MADNPAATEATLTELSILRQKIAVLLACIIDDANVREQTLAYIADDYLGTMGNMLHAMQMQEMRLTVSPSTAGTR